MMLKTGWVVFSEKGHRYRIQATYGVDEVFAQRNQQDPYFSITCDIDRARGVGWVEDGGGAAHETIAKHFPALAPLCKWHLCGVNNGPMHYVANGLYWWEIATGRKLNTEHGPDPRAALARTVVLGALCNDGAFDFMACEHPEMKEWLEGRLTGLLAAFQRDMAAAGVTWDAPASAEVRS